MIPNLSTAAVGAPITRLGISFFPVYLPGNILPEINTGTHSKLDVRELDNAQVNSLLAINSTDTPVLVVDGEHFLGGKQNRAINATVLIPARSERTLPVSCLEEGRWGAIQAYHRDEVHASPRIRRMIQEGVYDSMAQEQSRSSNQSNVWSEIQEELELNQAHSETGAAAENHRQIYRRDAKRAAAAKELTAIGPLPGQCGFAVSHGSWITTVELFGAPRLLAQHWETLIRSHLLERPNHSGLPSVGNALYVIRRFAAMATQEAPGIGLGTDFRVRDKKRIGQALMHEENLVHGSFCMRHDKAA